MVYPLTRAQGKAASRSDTARRLGEVAELEMAAYENCRCESQVSTSADGETSPMARVGWREARWRKMRGGKLCEDGMGGPRLRRLVDGDEDVAARDWERGSWRLAWG